MLLRIPNVLTKEQVAECRKVLDSADWTDGKVTAGSQSAKTKDNMQLPEDSPAARRLGDMILTALGMNPLFISATLAVKVFPPLFNRYQGGQAFGVHIDNAIRPIKGTQIRVRTDISSTLFLNAPEEYDGGELVIEDTFGTQQIKLPAGDMIIYPGTSLHRVMPVTRGARLASFFWSQSMVRDDGERRLLFELDTAIQHLTRDHADHPSLVVLANTYHNLLRQWAEI